MTSSTSVLPQVAEVAVYHVAQRLVEQVAEEALYVLVGFSAILWHHLLACHRQGSSHDYGPSRHPCVLHWTRCQYRSPRHTLLLLHPRHFPPLEALGQVLGSHQLSV